MRQSVLFAPEQKILLKRILTLGLHLINLNQNSQLQAKHNKNMEDYRTVCRKMVVPDIDDNTVYLLKDLYPNYSEIKKILVEATPKKLPAPKVEPKPEPQKPVAEDKEGSFSDIICHKSKSEFINDSQTYFSAKYPNDASTADKLNSDNIRKYDILCSASVIIRLKEKTLLRIAQYYPNYSTIQTMIDEEMRKLNSDTQQPINKPSTAYKPQPTIEKKESQPKNNNPACPYSESKVAEDSKANFRKQYPDSFTTQNMLHKNNMEAYNTICKSNMPNPLMGSAKKLFEQYYPSYLTIKLLLKSEMESYRELNK